MLVFHDMVRYGNHKLPKFVESYAEVGKDIEGAMKLYNSAVKNGSFPSESHRFTMKEEELDALYGGKTV